MSEDPTRSIAGSDGLGYGRVGPADPHEDPATRPVVLPDRSELSAPEPTPPEPLPEQRGGRVVRPTDDTVPVGDATTVRTPLPDAPVALPPGADGPAVATPRDPTPGPATVRRTRAGGLWTGLVASAVVLILLLVFILQNGAPVVINFLGWSGSLPTGVALLFAAVAGLLLVAIPGGLRMLQLRRAARRGPRR
jgi:uncharacterized integral membrane protein